MPISYLDDDSELKKYTVVEIQTNSDGTVGNLVYAYDDLKQAQSKFYSILSSAALSTLPVYSVYLLSNDGMCLDNKSFLNVSE